MGHNGIIAVRICGRAVVKLHGKSRVILVFGCLLLSYWSVGSIRGEREDETVVWEVTFRRGIQVKNRAYRGPQGEVVLAAWVNLEAGL